MSDQATKNCVLCLFGSFNPPTVGHINLLSMAKNLIEDHGYKVKKGLLIPTHGGYDKPGLANPVQRVEMCKLTTSIAPWADVEPHDTQQPQWQRAVVTLAYVQSVYPDCRIFFVCGADLVLRWNQDIWPDEDVIEIVTKYGVIMSSRNETIDSVVSQVNVLKGREQYLYLLKENPMDGVSSTLVRNLIHQNKDITGLLVYECEKYVIEQNLYH